jgi:hypothetical protein
MNNSVIFRFAMNCRESDMEHSLRHLDRSIESVEVLLTHANEKERKVMEVKLSHWKQRREQIAKVLLAGLKRNVTSNPR